MRKKWRHDILVKLRLWVLSIGFMSQNTLAMPVGPVVVEGGAAVSTAPLDPNHQIITQTTSKAIINWQDFSIGAHQITEFKHPNASAITLNRVLGPQASCIEGAVKANGQVWLINPSGILFGPNAKVDVAGLLATTSNIENNDFMESRYHFHEVPSSLDAEIQSNMYNRVINEGNIKICDSGLVALVAPSVKNSGVIEANLGKVVLGAGAEYTVDLYGDNLIHFATGTRVLEKTQQDAIEHSGKILSEGGKILLTTSDAVQVVDNLINMKGFIRANTAYMHEGEIVLSAEVPQNNILNKGVVKITGTMDAKGIKADHKGGKISISGERIGLFETASLDVSGDAGGGNIDIGGNYKGHGPLPHADAVFIGSGVNIMANANKLGDGGRVIAWSDNCTRVYGSLSAKGGLEGGNGGLIETSGGWLDTKGIYVNASAPKGSGGNWLLDPYNVSITDSEANLNGSYVSNLWIPTATPSIISTFDLIQNQLDNNVNTNITTTNAGGSEKGNITVTSEISDVDLASEFTTVLTLTAEGSIIVNALISRVTSSTGTFNLTCDAPSGNVILNAPVDLVSDNLSTGGTATIITQGLNGDGVITVKSLSLNSQNANFFGTVNGLSDGSNIDGMAASIAAYGPNYAGSSRYFFNGNEFFISLPPPPPPPTPTPTPTPTPPLVTPAILIPPSSITIEPNLPVVSEESIITTETTTETKTETKTETETTTETTKIERTTETTSAAESASTPTLTPGPAPIPASVPTPTSIPTPAPIPVIPLAGSIPVSEDVGIGGIAESLPEVRTEFPIFNIEDTAGIPGVEGSIGFETQVSVPVQPDKGVGPLGVNGTDVDLGSEGIGQGAHEGGFDTLPVSTESLKYQSNAKSVIGVGGSEEFEALIDSTPCPDGPNCIPGIDSLGCPMGPNCIPGIRSLNIVLD